MHQLTRSQICGNMCRAADNRHESNVMSSRKLIRAESDCDGAGTGEGAGDGRANTDSV